MVFIPIDNFSKDIANKESDRMTGELVELRGSYTAEEEKPVLRKINTVILPLSLSYTGIFGLIEDLNMTSSQYSWSSSIFYVGQLVSEYPFIYLMSRLLSNKFVGTTVASSTYVWLHLKPLADSLLYVFFSGPAKVSINGLARVLGCCLIYGISKNTSLTIALWHVLFIIHGGITLAAGVALSFFLMPNGPETGAISTHSAGSGRW
ncbi:unnamed protein product [Penicillium roqueforti FM164]|uniref:Genomic scaffold, ProqFM164S02 n=1 Tax=Penicillium roqueforti (strain FM164) TaxID=1365484 RepID=W6QA84_PENRF|nr:unnamed protein product [Penicillium roqueforti FM164]